MIGVQLSEWWISGNGYQRVILWTGFNAYSLGIHVNGVIYLVSIICMFSFTYSLLIYFVVITVLTSVVSFTWYSSLLYLLLLCGLLYDITKYTNQFDDCEKIQICGKWSQNYVLK